MIKNDEAVVATSFFYCRPSGIDSALVVTLSMCSSDSSI